jgi:hypothetical protein
LRRRAEGQCSRFDYLLGLIPFPEPCPCSGERSPGESAYSSSSRNEDAPGRNSPTAFPSLSRTLLRSCTVSSECARPPEGLAWSSVVQLLRVGNIRSIFCGSPLIDLRTQAYWIGFRFLHPSSGYLRHHNGARRSVTGALLALWSFWHCKPPVLCYDKGPGLLSLGLVSP